MGKETTYTMEIREFIRETGKMERRKVLENSLSMTSMDIQESGRKIKKMEKALTSILTEKDIRVHG